MSRLRVPDGVGFEVADGVVYVAPLPDGPIAVLEGAAALIWQTALDVDRDLVPQAIARTTSTPIADLEGSVVDFIDDLIQRGLLADSSGG